MVQQRVILKEFKNWQRGKIMAKKKLEFEEYINQLEKIVERLESEEETLESSILLYDEGMKISSLCAEMLDSAQQKLTVIESKARKE